MFNLWLLIAIGLMFRIVDGVSLQNSNSPFITTIRSVSESPSLIQSFPENIGNVFDSPSCIIAGGTRSVAIDIRKSPSVTLLVREGTERVDALASPSAIYQGLSDKAIQNAMISPSLQKTSEAKTRYDLPLPLITGHPLIKTALLAIAVNPAIGGLVIEGGRGTGKSVLARAVHRILPPIEVVQGSQYNVAPGSTESLMDDFLAADLRRKGTCINDLPSANITCPFTQIPLNIMEDRLFGAVDVKRTLDEGETVFTPGILASANRGLVHVDDINLLESDIVMSLLQSIHDGRVLVEREGMSVRYPCKPILCATFNSDDAEFKDFFKDRIGISLSTDDYVLTTEERVEVVNVVNGFNDGSIEMKPIYEEEERLRQIISDGRRRLSTVKISREQLGYLCEQAAKGECEGQRAEISAARIALAVAALRKRDAVTPDDLRVAVQLAIIPRLRVIPVMVEEMPPPPPQYTPSPPGPEAGGHEQDESSQQEQQMEGQQDEGEEMMEPPPTAPQFVVDASAVQIDYNAMKFRGKQRWGKGGKSGVLFSRDRGKYIRPVMPRPGAPFRLAIDATLREAAKQQFYRRKCAAAEGKEPKKIYLEYSDVRAKLMSRRAGCLVIFLVDASGSMALNRMNAAKGAACSLLSEAYKHRDKIALITVQGITADVTLPPTRSVALAKRRLDSMPCGGGSPLAHAILQGTRLGLNAMKVSDVGRVVLVLITDGRANVPLEVSTSMSASEAASRLPKTLSTKEKMRVREQNREEVIAITKKLAEMLTFKTLVIDTENKLVGTGFAKDIAQAARGRYHYLPQASAKSMTSVTKEALGSIRKDMAT